MHIFVLFKVLLLCGFIDYPKGSKAGHRLRELPPRGKQNSRTLGSILHSISVRVVIRGHKIVDCDVACTYVKKTLDKKLMLQLGSGTSSLHFRP